MDLLKYRKKAISRTILDAFMDRWHVCNIYGVMMEIDAIYSFFPGRYFEVLDIIANIIGSFVGLLLSLNI